MAAVEETAKKLGVMESMSKDTMIVILVISAMIAIVLVSIYIVQLIKKSNMKSLKMIETIISLENRQIIPFKIPDGKMSATTVGQEYSYGFWIYLSDSYATTTAHKIIFQRGFSGNTAIPNTTSPIIALDKATNKLMFAVSTTQVTNAQDIDQIFGTSSKYLTTTIDYLPLQRWVYVAMTVRDSMLTVYMDGDMYSVSTTANIPSTTGRPIMRGTSGDAYIGDSMNNVKGFVSKMAFFNYAMSQGEVQNVYNNGPITKSILSYFGIGNYAVRSPIYNIEQDAKTV